MLDCPQCGCISPNSDSLANTVNTCEHQYHPISPCRGQALLATIIQLMVSPKKDKCKQVNPVKSPFQTVYKIITSLSGRYRDRGTSASVNDAWCVGTMKQIHTHVSIYIYIYLIIYIYIFDYIYIYYVLEGLCTCKKMCIYI